MLNKVSIGPHAKQRYENVTQYTYFYLQRIYSEIGDKIYFVKVIIFFVHSGAALY